MQEASGGGEETELQVGDRKPQSSKFFAVLVCLAIYTARKSIGVSFAHLS